MKTNWNHVIDKLQSGLVWFVIGLVTLCVGVLILFDVLAGAGVMTILTNGNAPVAVVISLATTGLMLALMFIGYMLSRGQLGRHAWGVFAAGVLVGIVDVYFDSLGADVYRYGGFVALAEIDNQGIHALYRALIAGISLVGEPMAVAIITGMPVLKVLVGQMLGEDTGMTSRPAYAPKKYNLMDRLPKRTPSIPTPPPTSFFGGE